MTRRRVPYTPPAPAGHLSDTEAAMVRVAIIRSDGLTAARAWDQAWRTARQAARNAERMARALATSDARAGRPPTPPASGSAADVYRAAYREALS